jgi:ribosomal protein S18 acetylase RimI-like enzyme
MLVTTATLEDIPRLCELLAILFSHEAEFEPDSIRQTKGLEAIISNPSVGLILVLQEGNEIIGMVNLLFTVSTALGAKVANLEDMIIHPAHRGKGAGTFLMQAAQRVAAEHGCKRLTLLTDSSNSAAKAFYQKIGFEESTMTPFRLIL